MYLVRVNIETTDACNLHCSACMTPHGTNFMTVKDFSLIADKLVGSVGGLGLHWRGEPCLHPRLPEIAETAKEKGFKPWLSTNTAVPNLSKHEYVEKLLNNLDWIEFCVDGYDEDTTPMYRVGASWNTIRRNLQTISEVDGTCLKKMRVLMFKWNEGKENVYRSIAREAGMDVILFATPLIGLGKTITHAEAEKFLPQTRRYQRYTLKNKVWTRNTGPCRPNPIVSVHGGVYPCCLDWKLQHPLGNLKKEPWMQIMAKYVKMRPVLGRQEMCKLCCIPRQKIDFREKIK